MRIVTITSKSYLIGTLVLLRSIRTNGQLQCPVTIITLDEVTSDNREKIQGIAGEVDFFDIRELGLFRCKKGVFNKRGMACLNKLSVLNLPYEEPCLLLDSDMICLNRATLLLGVEPYAACFNVGSLTDMESAVNGRLPFNSGLLVFRPGRHEFGRIQDFADDFYGKGGPNNNLGDQHVWNAYIHHSRIPITMLSMEFNVTDTMRRKHGNFYSMVRHKTVFHHFASIKPWSDQPAASSEQYEWEKFAHGLSL